MNKGKVLAFVSIKGGVGKTTLALETASALSNNFGKKVLLVDGNFSAPNVGLYLDLTNEYSLHDVLLGEGLHNAIYEAQGFDVVPASMEFHSDVDVYKLKNVLSKFRNRYDYIIIDSSPNFEEMKPVVAAADRIFVVTTPDKVTMNTTLKAFKAARENQTPVEGVIVNKVNHPRYECSLEEIERTMDVPVMAKIKHDKKFAEALYHKKPLTIHSSSSGVSKEIQGLASAICGSPENAGGFFGKLFSWKDIFSREKINRDLMRAKFYESQL